MATHESKTLTAHRARKEKALATMREIQLAELQGSMVPMATVEASWSAAVLRMRDAMLAIPSRCASRFPDQRAAETILRSEIETALKQLKGRA